MVPLGRAIQHRKEFVEIDDFEPYKRCRVQLHAKGVVLRDIISGSEVKTKKQQVCRAGEFLVAEIDAKVGGFGLVPPNLDGAIVSSHYFLFNIDESTLDKRFLDYFVRTPAFRDQVSAQGSTNYAAIRPSHVLEYKVPLPPLPEQRRIVARIEELAARIEEARGLRRQAVEEAEALISLEVTRLFSNVEQRGWQVESLENYLVDTRYGTSQKTTDDDTGTPVLRMGNIQQGRLDLRDLKYLHLNDSELSNLHLARGDVLVNRTNSAELVGKCAVFDLEEEYVFASYLIRLRLDRTRVEPKLLSLYLNSPLGRAYMLKEKTQMTGQANVNAKKLRALPIALPSLPEQRRIVAYLDDLQTKVDSLKRIQADTAAELDALLPSVLDRAFKGEL
jgi:type I restriction enzyme S subunit